MLVCLPLNLTKPAGFSLSALEETMQENKRLSNSAAQSATLHSYDDNIC